jgi:hypothetical protein
MLAEDCCFVFFVYLSNVIWFVLCRLLWPRKQSFRESRILRSPIQSSRGCPIQSSHACPIQSNSMKFLAISLISIKQRKEMINNLCCSTTYNNNVNNNVNNNDLINPRSFSRFWFCTVIGPTLDLRMRHVRHMHTPRAMGY